MLNERGKAFSSGKVNREKELFEHFQNAIYLYQILHPDSCVCGSVSSMKKIELCIKQKIGQG